jgi:hypothetical protein
LNQAPSPVVKHYKKNLKVNHQWQLHIVLQKYMLKDPEPANLDHNLNIQLSPFYRINHLKKTHKPEYNTVRYSLQKFDLNRHYLNHLNMIQED